MMPEAELRDLHGRIKRIVRFVAAMGGSAKSLKHLAAVAMQLEWILELPVKPSIESKASLYALLNNLEGLQRSQEASERAGRQ